MDILNQVLADFGLSEKESRLYLAALEVGTGIASDIAQKAGIQRTHFYDLAKKLLDIGLMKQISKANKKLFHAVDPEVLLTFERQRVKRLEEELPRLKAIYNTASDKPHIFFYEGREGLDRINNDTLMTGGEIVGFTTPLFISKGARRYSEKYIQARKARGTRARIIGELSPEILELQSRDKKEFRETRILPQALFSSSVEFGTYGEKVFMVDYRQEFGFVIEGKEFARSIKQVFEVVWNSGRILNR